MARDATKKPRPKKRPAKKPTVGKAVAGGAWECDCRRNPGYLLLCVRCGKGKP